MTGLAVVGLPRVRFAAVALSGLAGIAASVLVLALAGPRTAPSAAPARSFSAPGSVFSLAVPAGWRALSPAELATVPARPAAVLRRSDGHGLVVVRRSAPVHASAARLMHDLGRRFRARFAGFAPTGARFAELRGGRAFVYTFTRAPRAVQTLALATAAGRAYEIDAIVPAGASGAARDAGAIVASFGP